MSFSFTEIDSKIIISLNFIQDFISSWYIGRFNILYASFTYKLSISEEILDNFTINTIFQTSEFQCFQNMKIFKWFPPHTSKEKTLIQHPILIFSPLYPYFYFTTHPLHTYISLGISLHFSPGIILLHIAGTYPFPARGVPDRTGPLVADLHVGGPAASVTFLLRDFSFSLVTEDLPVSDSRSTSVWTLESNWPFTLSYSVHVSRPGMFNSYHMEVGYSLNHIY